MEQFVIGIDLKEQDAQLCYWKGDEPEPKSVSLVAGEERYRITTGSVEEFLKKAMRLLRPVGKLGEADVVVFSVEDASEEMVEQVKMAAMRMGITEEKVYVQTDEESFCAYVMNQPREVHAHHVALFTYEEQELKADRHHEKKAGRFDKGLRNANSQLIKKIQIQTPDILEDKLTER